MAQPSSGLTYAQLTDEANRPEPTPEGEALSGTRMFEVSDLDMAEALVWVGRWAKGAESVSVRFSLPGNKTNFRESDVQQSLHAAMRRKHLPESLIDSVLPNADHNTGPWTQTMAAAAASELADDGWFTVFSADEGTQPVDFEVFVLDHTGKSHNYTRRDGVSHAELLEVRREQDKRKVVLFLTWPPEFKLYTPKKLEQAREATKGKVQAMLEDHAEHVSFGDCKDNQGHLLPKILIFVRHSEASSMAKLASALPQMRYIDVGLEVMVKTSLNRADLARLGIKACCYTPACVRGHPVPAKNGRPERPAPQCDAGQRAHATRMCYAARPARPVHTSNADRHARADKRAGEEQRANAARDAIEKAFRPPQECRAHEAGRCTKGDQCYESHNVPDSLIMCCSMLKFGQKHYKLKYSTCTSIRVGKECPYSHEPLEEQTEEEMADLLDASALEEANEAAEIALAEEAEQQSAAAAAAAAAATAAAGAAVAAAAAAAAVATAAAAAAVAAASAGVANPGEAAPLASPANGPPVDQAMPAPQHQPVDQALLASQHQANAAIEYYKSAQPGAEAEEQEMLDDAGL